MKVYRIQDSKGRGPFRPGFTKQWLVWREDLDLLQPAHVEFHKQVSLVNIYSYGVACLTENQLRRWFIKEEYETLLTYGFNAVKMEVDEILLQSNIQCVFKRQRPLSEDVEIFNLYEPS